MAISISNLSVLFSANTGRFKKNVRGAMKPLDRMRRTAASLTGSFAKLAGGLFALGGSFRLLRGTVGLVMRSIKESMEFERIEVGLAALVKDAGRAKVLFKDLQSFALSTTFVFKDTLAASRTMIAFGESIDNVIPTLAVLGNIAAAVNIPIQELAFIFEQSRVEGKLLQRDIRQFATRGIPVVEEIAKVLGIAKSEIGDLTKSGSIGFDALAQAFKNMATQGGRFAGLMGAVAQTVSGRFERLKDQVQLLLKTIGDEIVATFNLDAVLDRAFRKLQEFREKGKGAMRAIAEFFRDRLLVAVAVFDNFFRGFLFFGAGVVKLVALISSSITRIVDKLERSGFFNARGLRSLSAMTRIDPDTGKTVAVSPHLDAIRAAAAGPKGKMETLADKMLALVDTMPSMAQALKEFLDAPLASLDDLTKDLQNLAVQMKTEFDVFDVPRKQMEGFFDEIQKRIDKLDPKGLGAEFLAAIPKQFKLSRIPSLAGPASKVAAIALDAERMGIAFAEAKQNMTNLLRISLRGDDLLSPDALLSPGEYASQFRKAWDAIRGTIPTDDQGREMFAGIVAAGKDAFRLIKIEFDRFTDLKLFREKFADLSKKLGLANLKKDAQAIIEAIKTPAEAFAEIAEHLREIFDAGFLSTGQLGLAMKQARDDLFGTAPTTGRAVLANASEFGQGGGVTSSGTVLGELQKQTRHLDATKQHSDSMKTALESLVNEGINLKDL